MSKTILGYTQGKLEAKADKRSLSSEAYLHYLQFKRSIRSKNNRKRIFHNLKEEDE